MKPDEHIGGESNSGEGADEFTLEVLEQLSAAQLVALIRRINPTARAELLAEPEALSWYIELCETAVEEASVELERLERESGWLAAAVSRLPNGGEFDLLAKVYEGALPPGAFAAVLRVHQHVRSSVDPLDAARVLGGVLDLLDVRTGDDLAPGYRRAAFELVLAALRGGRAEATAAERASIARALAGLRQRAAKRGLDASDGLEPIEETNRRLWAIVERHHGRAVDVQAARGLRAALEIEVNAKFSELSDELVQLACGDDKRSVQVRVGHLLLAAGLGQRNAHETEAAAAFRLGGNVKKSLKPNLE
jgi:hypothetical protein